MFVKRIELLKQAREDLRNGKKFYGNAEVGIGDYFYDSLISDIDSLKIYAGVHEKQFNFFRMNSKRFPFFVYYKFESETATVVAVLDARQKPTKLIDRLN